MMERQEDDGDRKFSFSYDVGGEKLRLIDVSKEDDFLIDSPLFDSLEDLRLSVAFDGTNEQAFGLFGPWSYQEGNKTEETIMQKEQNLSLSGSIEPTRPSYLRKSLAWDSAFFNSAGVLDPDELAFINRGLNVVEDIRTRRAETKPLMHGSRKIDIGHHQNKIKTKPASQRHSIQRSKKTKIKHDSRREEASCKHPKPSERMEDLLRGQSINAYLNEYDVEIKNKTASRLGKDMMLCNKSALLNSCSLPSGDLSSPTFSSAFSISTSDNTVSLSPFKTSLSGSSRKVPSVLVKGKAESQQGNLCASTSPFGTPARLLKNNKELKYHRFSTFSGPIPNNLNCMSPGCSSDASLFRSTLRIKQQQPDELEAHLGTSVVCRAGLLSNPLFGQNTPHISQRKSSLSLQCEEIKSSAEINVDTVVGTCPVSTEPRKKFKPSSLRQPSPKIGFFDEEKAMFAKANGGQFQHEIQSTLPHEHGPINRKRTAKLLPDNTSPKIKTVKHSLESHLLQSAPGIKGRNTSNDKKLWNSSPRVSSAMKSWSEVALRRHTCKFMATEERICHKSQKVNARECDRKRVSENSVLRGGDGPRQVKGRLKQRSGLENKGQRDDMRRHGSLRNQSMEKKNVSQKTILDDLHLLNEDKTRIPSNWEDQVNDLSRYFDIIDLDKDMLIEFKEKKDPANSQNGDSIIKAKNVGNNSQFFDRENILDDQHEDLPNISPNPSQSLPFLCNSLPSLRTPLADRTSIYNHDGSFKSSGESTKGRLLPKASLHSFDSIDKENI